jgi:omega-amidase
MDKLRIALIQSNLIWENSAANLIQFDKQLELINQADIIVLPEMFNTGFTQNVVGMAQTTSDQAINWMKAKALEFNTALVGSLIVSENNQYFNRMVMAYPCSDIKWVDKRHLFRMGGEHENFTAGSQRKIFNYFGWRIRPLVCYDLRFPVWSRNQNDYDLLIYVANWPESRRDVWKTLLKARAIENQCFVVGVNRVGTDGMGIEYVGESMVIDAKGNIVCELPVAQEGIGEVTISLNELQEFRNKFPVHADADSFTISGIE